jgi:hypothetical protein
MPVPPDIAAALTPQPRKDVATELSRGHSPIAPAPSYAPSAPTIPPPSMLDAIKEKR